MKGLNIWDNEPDRLEFTVHGFKCLAKRINKLGHLCGYIMVEDTHPWYAKDYSELSDVDVHGGLTYSDKGEFGFDCAHAGDLVLSVVKMLPSQRERTTYRDMGYVVNELIKLANQAKEAQE